MPGKKPLVRYGVMTDDDIIETAGKYFEVKIIGASVSVFCVDRPC
jgi:hypothetical protein